MYNVLVVGCGGSGVKTVAFMMDQLKADLRRHGIEEIPACWQFLGVDTPVQEEDMSHLGVATLSDQGGQYVACGVSGGLGYPAVDAALTSKLTAERRRGLRELATWMPSRPEDVIFPLSTGAGQHRGIGRLLVLSHLKDISAAASDALSRMRDPSNRNLIDKVSKEVPGAGSPPSDAGAPLVLMVSSMAGGSGASMTLDVAQVIAMTDGYNPETISAFLYTADVFVDVPEDKRGGVSGNTLAMIGELVAVQGARGGAATAADGRLYSHFGLSSNGIESSLGRAIPIGAMIGGETGSSAGDDSATIFRSVGRGLARYIQGPAFEEYVHYDLSNPIQAATSAFGWGVQPGAVSWSSFGYASFSLGRERYLEYAAQRIARRVIDHALDGHSMPGDTRGDHSRLGDLWQQNKSEELRLLDLPEFSSSTVSEKGTFDDSVAAWLEHSVVSRSAAEKFAHQLIANVLGGLGQVADGVSLAQWQQMVSQLLARSAGAMRQDIEKEGLRLAYAWTERAQDTLVSFTTQTSGMLGVAYANHVLVELSADNGVLHVLSGKLTEISELRPLEPWVLPAELAQTPSGRRQAGALGALGLAEAERDLARRLEKAVYDWLLVYTSGVMAAAVVGYSNNAVTPMKNAVGDAAAVLKADRAVVPIVQGTAQVDSRFYEHWPKEPLEGQPATDSVPTRFGFANNEVVIMTRDQYVDLFDEHVVSSVASEMDTEYGSHAPSDFFQAYDWVVRDVLKGTWKRAVGEAAPEDDKSELIEVRHRWVANGFQRLYPRQTPRPASYRLRLRAEDILDRARKFVGRSGEAFTDFAGESIHHFLTDPEVSDYDRQLRLEQILDAMRKTIAMARPLSSINNAIYHTLHDEDARMHLEFSALPFQGVSQAAAGITKILQQSGPYDAATIGRVAGTGTNGGTSKYTSDPITRVDIFGSNARTLPVAYTGILSSVKASWVKKRGSSDGRTAFWKWRRSRPLYAGIPFGDAERKALIEGWFVAQLMGCIRLPRRSPEGDFTPVQIWDMESEEWVDFPTPMITAPSQFRMASEYLPAVLEASLLAFLELNSKGLNSFLPYNVLRWYSDASPGGPNQAMGVASQPESLIENFLEDGFVPPKGTARIDTQLATFDQRKEAALEWFKAVMQDLQTHYLPGELRRGKDFAWTNYTRREAVAQTPLTVDMAEEMVRALENLVSLTSTLEEKSASSFDATGYGSGLYGP